MHCIDTIQPALHQNFTVEELNIRNKLVFQRNKDTSKLELVKGRKFLPSYSPADHAEEDDASRLPIAVPEHTYTEISSVVPQSNMQTQYGMPSGNSESPCTESVSASDDDDFQASPAKRQKVGKLQ
jgi:hypothetical protein